MDIIFYFCKNNSWVKFEEDVEDGGNRWTKPFVGTLSLHALFELRSSLLNGTLLLDADATTVEEVISVIVDKVSSTHQLTAEQKNQVCKPYLDHYRYETRNKSWMVFLDDWNHESPSSTSLRGPKVRTAFDEWEKPQ